MMAIANLNFLCKRISLNPLHMHTPILLVVVGIQDAEIFVVFDEFGKLTVLEDVIVSLVYDRSLLVVDLAPLSVDVLKVAFVFEVQMPWHKHILLCELFLAYALLSFPLLLERPHIN